jgi:hypothetical protein
MKTVMMDISGARKISALQEEFKTACTNLKLCFYGKPNTDNGPHSETIVTQESTSLSDCRNSHNDGTITITPQMTIENLEASFRDVYGLKMEVFRKSGKEWIRTKYITKLSLEEQNQLD